MALATQDISFSPIGERRWNSYPGNGILRCRVLGTMTCVTIPNMEVPAFRDISAIFQNFKVLSSSHFLVSKMLYDKYLSDPICQSKFLMNGCYIYLVYLHDFFYLGG